MVTSGTTRCSLLKQKPSKKKLPKWKPLQAKAFFRVFFLTTLVGIFTTGCAESGLDTVVDDYTERLERVLDQEASTPVITPLPKFPARRDLRIDVPAIDIDLFDFLKLGNCELQSVVAERNSSLGRFAAESVALKQDIDFILLVENCKDTIEDPELAQTLEDALHHKQHFLDAVLWNALIAGPEYNELWTNDRVTYPHVAESKLQGALSVLQTQTEIVLKQEQLASFDAQQFEQALVVLRSGEAAALLASWRLVKDHLGVASRVVSDRSARRPLCFDNMRGQNAEIFKNVVFDKFIAGIQKDVAVLNQRYYEVVVPLQELEQLFVEIETPAYSEYRQARDALFIHGIDSIKGHVDAIELLMVQCGFLPSS